MERKKAMAGKEINSAKQVEVAAAEEGLRHKESGTTVGGSKPRLDKA